MEPTSLDVTAEPQWIRQGVRSTLGELRDFFTTGYAFARSPGRFAAEWVSGRRHTLNPAAMVATAASLRFVLTMADQAFSGDSKEDASEGILREILDAVGPHLHYAALGLIAHVVLRLSGPTRRVSSSIATAMFAGAGPAFFAELVVRGLVGVFLNEGGSLAKGALLAGGGATFLAFAWTVSAGLAGLHRRRTIWGVLAVATAFVATGFVFGAVRGVPATYGWHLVLWRAGNPAQLRLGVYL